MIGAAFLAEWFGASRAEPPVLAVAPESAASAFDLALIELRGALAAFDVVDELRGLADSDGYVMTDAKQRAHHFAAWALARAAQRLESAYLRDTDAEGAT